MLAAAIPGTQITRECGGNHIPKHLISTIEGLLEANREKMAEEMEAIGNDIGASAEGAPPDALLFLRSEELAEANPPEFEEEYAGSRISP